MKWIVKPRKEFKGTGRWFAWYPVRIYETNMWVWLEYVYWEYKILHNPDLHMEVQYRLKPIGT